MNYKESSQILSVLKKHLSMKQISLQQYRTLKGQILAGDINGCLKGLNRISRGKNEDI